MSYASFQGRVYLGQRDSNGLPFNLRSPGNIADLKVALKVDNLEHYESQSGQRSLDLRLPKQKSATVSLTIEEFTRENLALALYGSFVVNNGGTVTDEPFSGPMPVIGDRYLLAHQRVSALVVKDSSATPKTLVDGTDYTADLAFGAVQFLRLNDGGTPAVPYVAPFKASYAFGTVTEIGMFTQPLPERFLRLEGINTAQNNAPVLVELYRVAFDPLKDLSLISDDLAKFPLEGALLADPTKPVDATLGQFGRVVMIA